MNVSQESIKTASTKIFQGIGIVYGRIKIDESQKALIDIEGETFELKQTKAVRRKLIPYKEEHPDTMVYLRVYPGFNPQSQKLWFQANRFYPSQPESTTVNQFILAGVWQYIPQLPNQPVISIYRNNLRPGEKVENARANHLPVQGFAEEAYRYQPSAKGSTSPKRKFYELLVQLNPQQRAFDYLQLLDSTEKIPPYIKKKKKKPQPSQPKLTVKVTEMNFTALQKTAIKLREAGFLKGKVSGKGITFEALSAKVLDSLNNHPEAEKVLCLGPK
ncbi:MAG: hypothetical protein QNJ55_22690 [Xenococcus sp. MO_188.B8]|nr:hypothetical protein [Xenococcus sp. MO_188.B8]